MKKYHKLDVKLSYFFLILLLLVAVLIGNLTYLVSYRHTVDYSKHLMRRCGQYVDETIDSGLAQKWLEKGKDDDYILTQKDLEAIKTVFKISYLYVYRPEYDNNGDLSGEVTYLFDLNPEDVDENKQYELGQKSRDIPEFDQVKELMATGSEQYNFNLHTSREGKLMTVLVPLKAHDGSTYAVIGVCFPMENVKNYAVRTTVILVIVFEAVILIFAVILLLFIRKRVIGPVKLLSSRMDSFVSSGNEITRFEPIRITTHDELEYMTDNFNSMAESIIQYTKDLQAAAASQERLRAELDVARNLRSAMSAETDYNLFNERKDFELYASLKNTVYNSCSFTNYFLVNENRLFIVMGESVGKTLPSMLMSMLASANIGALAKKGNEPYRIAYDTNNSLCRFESNEISMTVSALMADIDLRSGTMRYVNAGMPPIIIRQPGEAYRCDEEEELHFNLGEMHGVSFQQKSLRLCQGSTLFMTSYGVTEMKNPDGEEFTEKRLSHELNRLSGKYYSLNEMVSMLEKHLDEFRNGTPVLLDTTILGFRYFG